MKRQNIDHFKGSPPPERIIEIVKDWEPAARIAETIIAKITALFAIDEKSEILNYDDWEICCDGRFIVHKKFKELLNIEDCKFFSSDDVVQLIPKYLDIHREYRRRHWRVFNQAYGEAYPQLTQEQKEIFDKHLSEGETIYNIDRKSIIGIPFYDDEPELWEKLGIKKEDVESMHFSIYSQGLIFASNKSLDKLPASASHHFFARLSSVHKSSEKAKESFLNMAKHEGSHGISEYIVIRILELKSYSAIMEGLVEAQAEGSGITQKTNISFDSLLDASYMANDNLEGCYIAAPKYYSALFSLLKEKEKNVPDETLWSKIVEQMIYTAFQVQSQPDNDNDEKKTSSFFKILIINLGLNEEYVRKKYDNLNEEEK